LGRKVAQLPRLGKRHARVDAAFRPPRGPGATPQLEDALMTESPTHDPPTGPPDLEGLRALAAAHLLWYQMCLDELPAAFVAAWLAELHADCEAAHRDGEDWNEHLVERLTHASGVIWRQVTGAAMASDPSAWDRQLLAQLRHHGLAAAPLQESGLGLLERAIARRGVGPRQFPRVVLRRAGEEVEDCARPQSDRPWFRQRAEAADALAALMVAKAAGHPEPVLDDLPPERLRRVREALAAVEWVREMHRAGRLLEDALVQQGVDPRQLPDAVHANLAAAFDRGEWMPHRCLSEDLGARRGAAAAIARAVAALLAGEPSPGGRAGAMHEGIRGIMRDAGMALPSR
jgi:hypothetical protein